MDGVQYYNAVKPAFQPTENMVQLPNMHSSWEGNEMSGNIFLYSVPIKKKKGKKKASTWHIPLSEWIIIELLQVILQSQECNGRFIKM